MKKIYEIVMFVGIIIAFNMCLTSSEVLMAVKYGITSLFLGQSFILYFTTKEK